MKKFFKTKKHGFFFVKKLMIVTDPLPIPFGKNLVYAPDLDYLPSTPNNISPTLSGLRTQRLSENSPPFLEDNPPKSSKMLKDSFLHPPEVSLFTVDCNSLIPEISEKPDCPKVESSSAADLFTSEAED